VEEAEAQEVLLHLYRFRLVGLKDQTLMVRQGELNNANACK
jgi:hypothetical protein